MIDVLKLACVCLSNGSWSVCCDVSSVLRRCGSDRMIMAIWFMIFMLILHSDTFTLERKSNTFSFSPCRWMQY